MKRMLFNATQAEELRVAIVDGQKLIDLDIESANKEERKSNIYKAVITRIEPSLEAAFVDYGSERHGFLPFKEIARSYFQPGADSRATIREALREGQELIVQVEKDERGNKGAALTTYISLAGRYLVLMPNNPRGGGVSRRIEGDERTELREAMDQLEVPQGMSLIARTAAIGRSAEELQWDLNYLLHVWRAIENEAGKQSGAFLIYQEGSLVIRAIRDYFQPDIGEILIDTNEIFEQACQFMGHVMPDNVSRIKPYNDDVPLFSRFQIEHQIESAYSRQVNLPSGGAIVIDHTEALVSIDVNSGRSTKGADIEETALRTNLEAAEEIARQLRLRDLGGLIVIDFIDMDAAKNQREIENRLREALRYDRARVQTSKISRFGLLELSRQRLRPALAETSYITCPRCTGTGHIRSTESSALHILRILEEEAMKENTGAVHLQAPVDVATFLLNEKRVDIARIEFRHKIQLIIVPNRHIETPAHEITRLRYDQINSEDIALASYQRVQLPVDDDDISQNNRVDKPARQEAAVKSIAPLQPAPAAQGAPEESGTSGGMLTRITGWFSNLFTGTRADAASAKTQAPRGESSENRPRGERAHRASERGERSNGERGEHANERDGERRNRGNGRGSRAERPEERRDNRNAGGRAERAETATEADKPRRQAQERGNRVERGDDTERPENNHPPASVERGEQRAEGTGRRRNRRNQAADEGDKIEAVAQAVSPAVVEPATVSALETSPVETEGTEKESTEKRRRRSRGGRRRGAEAVDNGDIIEAVSATAVEAESTALADSAIVPAPVPALQQSESPQREMELPPRELPQKELPFITPTEPAPENAAPTDADAALTPPFVPAAVPALANDEAEAESSAPIELAGMLQEAGLVMIETSTEKQGGFGTGAPEEPVRRGRKPRSMAVSNEEPLQQVETHKNA